MILELERFLHPGDLCKCCHPNLHPAHPSVDCACCAVEWEKAGSQMPLAAFVQSKLDNVAVRAQPKAKPKQAATPTDINIALKNAAHSDEMESLLFCGEQVRQIDSEKVPSLAEILTDAGLFPSRGQARKSGWDGVPPPGFNQFHVGKRRVLVTVWIPVRPDQE